MGIVFPRAVIFDWDNTLVDSWGAIGESINYVRAKYGLETWTHEQIIERCTRSAREAFPDWFGDQWQNAHDDFYTYFQTARTRIGLHALDGAADLLQWLFEHKIPALVVSNKSGVHLREEATELGWDRYFKAVIGAHDAPRDKPAREHADHALTLAGLQACREVWFIGDSEADITCARNADCTPVLIGNSKKAEQLGIDFYVANCRDLLNLLSAQHRAMA